MFPGCAIQDRRAWCLFPLHTVSMTLRPIPPLLAILVLERSELLQFGSAGLQNFWEKVCFNLNYCGPNQNVPRYKTA